MFGLRKTTVFIALLVLLAILVGALPPRQSQPAEAPAETEGEAAEADTSAEPVPIRVSVAPYFDYQMVTAAEQFGWDEELGVDLQITYMQDNAGQVAALTNNSLDVSAVCLVCNFQFYGSQPELRTFMTTNQFKGFAVIGRKGKIETYADFLEELGDPEEAKQATLAQFKDSTWTVNMAAFKTLISAMLSQADMTLDDIEVIGFSDDPKAALAFINGEGDFYTGSLPQETRLLLDFPDEFVNVGGDEIIGPAGLWFSNFAALDPRLQENEDAALKFMAMNYRFNRMMNECPSQTATILAEAVNAQTGSDFAPKNARFITQEFERYPSPQEELAETNNPDSPVYWGNSAKFYMDEQIRNGDLPEGSTYQEFNPMDDWMDKLLARQDLIDWINSPGACNSLDGIKKENS